MNGSIVVDLQKVRESTGWKGTGQSVGQFAGGFFAEKGSAMASGGHLAGLIEPTVVAGAPAYKQPARPGQPARLTGAVLGAKRAAFRVGVGSGGTALAKNGAEEGAGDSVAPAVLAFVDPQIEDGLAGETPRPAPTRRRIRTGMRLDAEQGRRLNLVAGFTGRTAQAVIVSALQAYLRDLVPCSATVTGDGTSRTRRQRGYAPPRGTRRSLRLHPHLFWRLMIAAQRGRRSMQSILTAALDSHLDIVAPSLCAEVFDCLMGWTGAPGTSTPRSKARPAHWRAQGGRPLGRRRTR